MRSGIDSAARGRHQHVTDKRLCNADSTALLYRGPAILNGS
jgi:hypothetical protein